MSVSEEDLFPMLTKDDVAREITGKENPDYNLLTKLGVTNNISDIPGVNSSQMNAFNRYYKIFPGDEAGSILHYIFIVRPDLNMDYCVKNDQYFRDLMGSFPNVVLSLTQTIGPTLSGYTAAAGFPAHHFIPWLVPRTLNYPITDITLKTYDYEQPYTNYHSAYAGNANESRSGAQASISFRETAHLEVTKLMYAWVRYIDGVTLGTYPPRAKYVNSRILDGATILDYATSIYDIAVRANGTEIVFVHKTTGLFPTEVPLSSWSHDGNANDNTTINVQFSGGFPEAFDPAIMADFNYNAGMNRLTSVRSTREYDIPVVGTPFITWNTAKKKYYLRWQPLLN